MLRKNLPKVSAVNYVPESGELLPLVDVARGAEAVLPDELAGRHLVLQACLEKNTICPRSSKPFYIVTMGNFFLVI